jgi:hypothetical protein
MDFPRRCKAEGLPKLIRANQLEQEMKDVRLEDKTSQKCPSSWLRYLIIFNVLSLTDYICWHYFSSSASRNYWDQLSEQYSD